MKEQIILRRIFASATIMAVASTLLLIHPNPFYLFNLIADILINMFGIKVALRCNNLKFILVGVTYLYSIAFVFTKMFQIIDRIINQGVISMIITVLLITGTIIVIYRNTLSTNRNVLYKVTLRNGGISEEVKALYDTGNILRDYATGKPVSVVEEDCFVRFKKSVRPEKYKIIPYRTIGKEHGILEGIVIDEMIIWKANKSVVLKNVVLGCYKGMLSKDGSYQMILNQSLL